MVIGNRDYFNEISYFKYILKCLKKCSIRNEELLSANKLCAMHESSLNTYFLNFLSFLCKITYKFMVNIITD